MMSADMQPLFRMWQTIVPVMLNLLQYRGTIRSYIFSHPCVSLVLRMEFGSVSPQKAGILAKVLEVEWRHNQESKDINFEDCNTFKKLLTGKYN